MERFHEDKVLIPFGSKQLEGALTSATGSRCVRTAVILTHGAGGDMNFKHLVSLAHAVACKGILCLRFTCKGLNLGYRVKAYHAAWEYLKSLEEFKPRNIFIGGRSLGSRAASALAKQLGGDGGGVQGLVCLSFPLHPPGQTHAHRQRSEDLRGLPENMPVLFVSGTEDNMCARPVLEEVVRQMEAPATVHWVDGGSHGLTLRGRGRSEESLMEEVNTQVLTWISQHT